MLEELIQQEILDFGPLPQSRFMELALQHPDYGYYRTNVAISKDFTTSPEISQAFGELIGAWAINIYEQLGSPEQITLVELGPGRGTLLTDFLRVTNTYPPFQKAINLHLVEINPQLKRLQEAALPPSTTWHNDFRDIPLNSNPLIVIANEFFDTFPTDFYVREDNKLYHRCFGLDGPTLTLLGESPGPDQCWEESIETEKLYKDICRCLHQQSGALLCIDYGYEKGAGETLQALYQGKPSNPFAHIGDSDLTCHVNFGRLKEIAHAQKLIVSGPLPQGIFLHNLGFETRMAMLKQKNPDQAASLEAARLRLTHPNQMGNLFKALAITSPSTFNPLGFH